LCKSLHADWIELFKMQTFLPYPDFKKSAQSLDYRRLQNQIVECHQLLKALTSPEPRGWRNHPAALMWKGHEKALAQYAEACWDEWKNRGYGPDHKSIVKIREIAQALRSTDESPRWIGDEEFHASHRGNLLRKDLAYYSQYNWTESPDLEYIWPTP